MNLSECLDIILITWNRKDFLRKTLNYIFNDDSPIKYCDITIFDNHSTDGTGELIEEYKKLHPNITHIVNKYNIGGNANICRAIEYPSKKYFWVLCDDDDFDWSNWQEIEYAMEQDYDAIMVEWKHVIPKTQNEGFIWNNMCFLPSTIYKTENVTDDVIYNAYANILYNFPHLALSAHILNENKRIFIPSKKIIDAGIHEQEYYATSVYVNPKIHYRPRNFNLFTGIICSAKMIHDKTKRARAMSCLYQGRSLFYSIIFMYKTFNKNIFNLMDIFLCFNLSQKLIMIIASILYLISVLFCWFAYFEKKEDGIYIHMFGNKFKTYLFRWKSKDRIKK